MTIISIIFAMDANRIIGNNGNLPWHLPSDLQRFRDITAGSPVIMGRKTFESILARNGKPLSGRINVVITRNAKLWRAKRTAQPDKFPDCIFAHSLGDALALFSHCSEIFIIGGAEIYAQAISIANRMYFTQVGGNFEGDATFPLFNMNDWDMVSDRAIHTDNHPYVFSVLNRRHRKSEGNRIIGDNLVNPDFARADGYRHTIANIIKDGGCPFCPDHLLWHPWTILHRIGEWFITRNGWPYENAEHHFLIIGERHIPSITEMIPQDDAEVKSLIEWAVKRYALKGYGTLSRSGDTSRTGSSVQHFHFHLIQPKLDSEGKALPVWFPIG